MGYATALYMPDSDEWKAVMQAFHGGRVPDPLAESFRNALKGCSPEWLSEKYRKAIPESGVTADRLREIARAAQARKDFIENPTFGGRDEALAECDATLDAIRKILSEINMELTDEDLRPRDDGDTDPNKKLAAVG